MPTNPPAEARLTLKACPFCGSDNVQFLPRDGAFCCIECGALGPCIHHESINLSEPEARISWNTRPRPAGEGLWLVTFKNKLDHEGTNSFFALHLAQEFCDAIERGGCTDIRLRHFVEHESPDATGE